MHADTGSSHEEPDSDCIRIHLAAIFGYMVGNIGEHLLEKIRSISVARSSGMRPMNCGLCGWTKWQAKKREFLWTGGDGNEKKNA
jgi:hypothetical protein